MRVYQFGKLDRMAQHYARVDFLVMNAQKYEIVDYPWRTHWERERRVQRIVQEMKKERLLSCDTHWLDVGMDRLMRDAKQRLKEDGE